MRDAIVRFHIASDVVFLHYSNKYFNLQASRFTFGVIDFYSSIKLDFQARMQKCLAVIQ